MGDDCLLNGHEEMPPPSPAHELAWLISEISEDTICATWEHGIEHEAWGWVLRKPSEPFERMMGMVSEKDVDKMRDISSRIGGWVAWFDDADGMGVRFVPMAKWQAMYKKGRSQ